MFVFWDYVHWSQYTKSSDYLSMKQKDSPGQRIWGGEVGLSLCRQLHSHQWLTSLLSVRLRPALIHQWIHFAYSCPSEAGPVTNHFHVWSESWHLGAEQNEAPIPRSLSSGSWYIQHTGVLAMITFSLQNSLGLAFKCMLLPHEFV